jgi:hypothetical protein
LSVIDQRVNHLAGLIPVAGQPLDFNFPWHDSLQPIGKDYLAIERSVIECAYAGCRTIWVVCHDDMQPLIRYRLGEYIQDPVYLFRSMAPGHAEDTRRPIPIYYVPIHPKDRDKRDCLAWSVLYGAMAAYYTSTQVSKWVRPHRYYTSFPYGLYDPEILREYRKELHSDQGFYLQHDGKTVKDGEYLGFSFTSEEFIKYRRHLRKTATGDKVKGTTVGAPPTEKLPLEERWSARHFSLDKVFGIGTIEDAMLVNVPWYQKVDSWEGLKTFLSSDEQLEKPKNLLKYHEFNRIGEQDGP